MTTLEISDVHRGMFLYSLGAQFVGMRFCRGAVQFVFRGSELTQWNAAYEQGQGHLRPQQVELWSPLFCERVCEHLGIIGPQPDEEGGEEHGHD